MLNRKEFIKNTGKLVAGVVIGATGIDILSKQNETNDKPLIFNYVHLDIEKARIDAHSNYYKAGCGYSGFATILNMLKEKIGEPYSNIPDNFMNFASGGIKGWGTTCGAINGAAAIVNLIADNKKSTEIINELFNWYNNTAMPTDDSNNKKAISNFTVQKYQQPITQSISNSPLCHVSLSNWKKVSPEAKDNIAQRERCARLCSDVVAKTIDLLNNLDKPNFVGTYKENSCLSCHSADKPAGSPNTKMDCVDCHPNAHK